MDITITPGPLKGTITPPPSKSQAHRLIIAASLAAGGRIENLADSQDITATRACMKTLCSPGGDLPQLDCGESGSTLRFLIPVALVLRGGGVFTGRGRLMERPQAPYFSIFREKGIAYSQADGALTVSGTLTPGRYALPGDVSSQFITGLLYALPLLPGDSEIQLTTGLESRGYVDMTLQALKIFGVQAEYDGDRRFFIPGSQRYVPADTVVEGDYSQAAFYYAANGLGSSVEILGMNAYSTQGDMRICPYYAKLCGRGEVALDVSQCPDLVPPLAAHAALRGGESTRICNAARLRIKESDRLATVTEVLNTMGAQIEEGPDSLTIHGVDALKGDVTVSSHNDHRIAMMAAIAATRCAAPVTITGAECVAKSYPNFWEDYASLGGQLQKKPE